MPRAAAGAAPRKRTRKRKRRAVSESSSSSSSLESDGEEPQKPSKPAQPVVSQPETSSSSESSSDSSSDSESEPEPAIAAPTRGVQQPIAATKGPIRRTSPSPSPPPAELPAFINAGDPIERESEEQLMKAKFRKFWMASVADGFKDDLEEIRKEPNLGASRLSLLIDSLASGADVFTTPSQPNKSSSINEMEVILE